MRLAHFLRVQKNAPAAASTLATLVVALYPALAAFGAAQADALRDDAERAHGQFASFHGDQRVAHVLQTGARPKGTTPAGPMARFMIQTPKK